MSRKYEFKMVVQNQDIRSENKTVIFMQNLHGENIRRR